jgi:hypothetical protein
MNKSLILLALVAGCGASDQAGNASNAQSPIVASASVAPSNLTGLYEGGSRAAASQLCIIEKGREAHFGMLVWGANLSACGGAGLVERDGDRLRFRMTGDQACAIEGRISNGSITLSGPAPAGCHYYCGARVGFGGATFARMGSTVADAMKATDPAGDPLCSN